MLYYVCWYIMLCICKSKNVSLILYLIYLLYLYLLFAANTGIFFFLCSFVFFITFLLFFLLYLFGYQYV